MRLAGGIIRVRQGIYFRGKTMLCNKYCSKCKYNRKPEWYDGLNRYGTCTKPNTKPNSNSNTEWYRMYSASSLYGQPFLYYYGTEPHILPCFEPRPKPPLWRLPVAIILGVVWSVGLSIAFLFTAHLPFAGIGFPPLPSPVPVFLILAGCGVGVYTAILWYRRRLPWVRFWGVWLGWIWAQPVDLERIEPPSSGKASNYPQT